MTVVRAAIQNLVMLLTFICCMVDIHLMQALVEVDSERCSLMLCEQFANVPDHSQVPAAKRARPEQDKFKRQQVTSGV